MSLSDLAAALPHKLLYVLLVVSLAASACGGGETSEADEETSAPESGAEEGDQADSGTDDSESDDSSSEETGSADSESAESSDSEATDSSASNPAAEEIRELISAQSSLYGWDKTQVNCIADAVIATGEPSPGDVANDVYAEIISDCNGLRGQLEFAMGITHSPTVANCVVGALSDDEVTDLGVTVLAESFEVAEAAMDEALAALPECA